MVKGKWLWYALYQYWNYCRLCGFQHYSQPLSFIWCIPWAAWSPSQQVKDTKEATAFSSPLHVLQQMELTHGVNNRHHSRSGRPWWKLNVRYLLEQIKQCPRDCTRHFFNPFNSATTLAVLHHHHVNTSTGCSDNPMLFVLWLLFHSSRHGQTCKAPFFSLLFHIVIAESFSITTHHVWLVVPAFYETGTHHKSHNKPGYVREGQY